MQHWEYYTTFLQAEARYETEFLEGLRDWKEGIPEHTPEALIPRLNALGELGWEIVQMQPVAIGNKADIVVNTNNNMRGWTYTYFCVFKRPRAD